MAEQPNLAGDKPSPPSGQGTPPLPSPAAGSMSAAMERLRAARSVSPSPQGGTSNDPPAQVPTPEKPKGLLEGGTKSEAPAVRDKPEEDDDFFGEPSDDTTSGASKAPATSAASAEDDPVVWTTDDGTPVRRSQARDGWMMRKDYTAKTEQAAAQRQAFEAAAVEANRVREDYLGKLAKYVTDEKAKLPQLPDPALKITDPLGYSEGVADYVAAKARFDENMAELQRVNQEHQQAQLAQFETRRLEEQERMIEAIPALRRVKDDPVKLSAAFAQYKRGAAAYGYKPEEIAMLVDHRAVRLLDDALRWRAYSRRKGSGGSVPASDSSGEPHMTLKGTSGAGAGTGPGTGNGAPKSVADAQAALRQSGKMDDAARVLRARREARQRQQR